MIDIKDVQVILIEFDRMYKQWRTLTTFTYNGQLYPLGSFIPEYTAYCLSQEWRNSKEERLKRIEVLK